MKLNSYITLIRPKQWIKNFFIFAPAFFAGSLSEPKILKLTVIAFVAFCLLSSSVYVINDIFDVEADRIHPRKKFRPLATGEISITAAIVLTISMLILALLLTTQLNLSFGLITITYLLINLLYSFKVKHIVILDVFFISLGFVLRIEAGATAIGVSVSSWMMLTTIFLSLFLAISKRRAELTSNEPGNLDIQRKVLSHYDVTFADQMNTLAATGTVICYALYTVSEKAISTFHSESLIYTTPFVVYGMFRYLYLLHKKNLGESPELVVTKDISLIINVFLWLIVSLLIIYKHKFPFLR
ncbi:MAG: decaprenyl-phosphate phosphoribosyltransferase [Ignavibacteria bacterium]